MKTHVRTWLLVGIGVAVLCAPAQGHHSFAEYYIEADTIEIEGEVLEFQYKNPHSWIHVMGQEPFGGGRKPYAAEWASVSRLERDGITAKTKGAQAFGLSGYPYFVFVDAQGKVVGRTSGEIEPDQLEGIFQALAKGQTLPLPGAGASSSTR